MKIKVFGGSLRSSAAAFRRPAAERPDAAHATALDAAATTLSPPIAWGVADDASKYADDGGDWFYGELKGASLTQNRWTLAFDPS